MPTLTPHAKAIVAALVAVVVVGVTTYQSVASGGFRWVDLVPVAAAVIAAVQTKLVPNVPELPWAKSAVQLGAAVVGAISVVVAADPTGVSVAKIGTVVVGAFLVWFVPEAAPFVAELENPAAPVEIPGSDQSALASIAVPDLPLDATQPIPVVAPAAAVGNA